MGKLTAERFTPFRKQPYRFSGGYNGFIFVPTEQDIRIPDMNTSRPQLSLAQMRSSK